jgi:hypothetical protein
MTPKGLSHRWLRPTELLVAQRHYCIKPFSFTHNSGDVPLPSKVFRQQDIAWADSLYCAVPYLNLRLSR